MKKLRRCIRALWWFRRELWNWNDVSWEAQYLLLTRGLEALANHIEEHDFYEDCEDDVKHIREALVAFEEGQEALWYEDGITSGHWNRFHNLLRWHARDWWC